MSDLKGDFCRIILIVLTCVYLVCGCLIAGLGVFTYYTSDSTAGTTVEKNTSIIFIWVGVVIFAIACWGCFGAICENVCMLYIFAAILIIVIGAKMAFIAFAHRARNRVRPITEKSLRDSIKNYFTHHGDKARWDTLQNRLKCCGVTSYDDWKSVPGSTGKIPESCGAGDEPKNRLGCLDRILQEFETLEVYFKTGAIFVAVIEIIGIILACCVSSNRRSTKSLS